MPESRFIDLLKDMVEFESPTGDVEGVRAVAAFIAAELGKRGLAVERRDAPGFGVHLVGRKEGPGDGRPLLIVTHMDTVHPVGTLDRLPFSVEEEIIRGPGVYDMKGGIAMALVALDRLAERGGHVHGGLVFLVTCDEEVGSASSRALIEALAGEARAALVLEPPIPGGGAKTARKGMGEYVVRVTGRAAHSGIEPEKGASAIHEMARLVLAMTAFADPGQGSSINVGTIQGGTTTNVVAAEAVTRVDVRFWSRDEAERIDASMKRLAVTDPRCTLEVTGGVNRHALEKTPENAALYEVAAEEAQKLGFELAKGGTGGASDGNLTSAVGCPTLDGLGPDGSGAHTLDERILRRDLSRRIEFLSRLIESA